MRNRLPSRRSKRAAKRLADGAPSRGGTGIRGKYKSEKTGETSYYDSSYELARFKTLDETDWCVHWTKKHGIRIPYYDLNLRKMRMYVPDILVTWKDGSMRLEEIKGFVTDQLNFQTKCANARAYCHSKKNMMYKVMWAVDLWPKKVVKRRKKT